MLQRRTFTSGLAAGALCAATSALAQRPANPIARPIRPRLDRPLVAGRFDPGAGVAGGALPGVYVVLAVDARNETLQLRDEGGRTGIVHVSDDLFDIETLKPGDEVEVDFLVPQPGSTRLEAGGIWKVQR
jgi:hypothetical protein